MKNYLLKFKKILIRNQLNLKLEDKEVVNDIKDIFGIDTSTYDLKKISVEMDDDSVNRYEIDDRNMIYFYALNDRYLTFPLEFYKNDKLIIDNQKTYSQINNLDELILQLVRVFDKALDDGNVIHPYYFMLKLEDEIIENYNGKATLVISEEAILNSKISSENFDETAKYFINLFLDHFICWNFGASINRNQTLKYEIDELNEKVIKKGIREWSGPGLLIYGSEEEEVNGLQLYSFPQAKFLIKTYNDKQKNQKKS